MVVFRRVLTGIGLVIILLPLVFAAGCNRDQSSSSQKTSSSSLPDSNTAQSSPAAVTESSSTADTATGNATTTASTPSTATAVGASSATSPATTTTTQGTTVKAGPENYGQVKVGMSSQEVVDLMGKASKIEQEGQATEWEYYLPQGGKFELRLQNDKVISTRRH